MSGAPIAEKQHTCNDEIHGKEHDQEDAAFGKEAEGQVVRDLGKPLGIDPRLAEGGEGIGILANKVVCGQQSLSIAQMPPDIGVAHHRTALLDIQRGKKR